MRGRLRSLLEQTLGLAVTGELVYLSKRRGQEVRIHQSDRPDDDICVLFRTQSGTRGKGNRRCVSKRAPATSARLTIYDAPLLVDSITPQMRENLDDELTEVKSENAVDRITSQANPRTLERVSGWREVSVSAWCWMCLCEEDKPLLGAGGRRSAIAGRRCPGRRRQPWERARVFQRR